MAVVSTADVFAGRTRGCDTVTVRGWVRTRRDSKAGVSFIHLSDGSSFAPLQIVAPAELANYEAEILQLTSGASLIATGVIVASQGKGQSVELRAERIEVIGRIDDPEHYPLGPKHHSFEYLREIAHLRPRTNTFGAITRVRHALAQAIHRYLDQRGFYWINTPIVTTSDCEGAGELFRVSTLDMVNLPRDEAGRVDFGRDFFGKEAFLTVSGQLNVEAYCLAMSKVYTFGPTFRAENSHTPRHLAEFWMIEPEIAFADLSDDADLAEDFLKSIIGSVLDACPDDMAFFDQRIQKGVIERLSKLVESSFERIQYTDAITLLQKAKRKWEYQPEWGQDLQTEHERYLTEEHCKQPVVVMNYPRTIKAFYMRLNDDERTVAAMDVLAPGIGEIIGGSQREERLEILDLRLGEGSLPAGGPVPPRGDLWWYRDLRRYGTVPHAGFGLGFERMIAYITGMANVRDVIPYPRTPGLATF